MDYITNVDQEIQTDQLRFHSWKRLKPQLGMKSQLGDMGLAQVIPYWACCLFFNRFFVIWAFSSFIFHHVSAKIMLQLTLWFLEHSRLCQSSRSWNVDEMDAFLCHTHFALGIFHASFEIQLDIFPLKEFLYQTRLQKETDSVLTLGWFQEDLITLPIEGTIHRRMDGV